MPKIHRLRGVTTEIPTPGDPAAARVEPVEVLADTPDDAEPVTDPQADADAARPGPRRRRNS